MSHSEKRPNPEPEKLGSLFSQDFLASAQPLPPHLTRPVFHPTPTPVSGILPPGFHPRPPTRVNGGWTAHKSGNLVYYYNTLTGVSQWERPLQFHGDIEALTDRPKPSSTKPIASTNWNEVTCEDGRIYYLNTTTNATSWSPPSDLIQPKPHQLAKEPETPQSTERPMTKVGRKATSEEIETFLEFLEDLGINAYSSYEKEAIKYEDEPRWNCVSLQRERKQLFNEFCQNAATQERAFKKKSHDEFERLLNELSNEEETKQNSEFDHRSQLEESRLFSLDSTLEDLELRCRDDPRWKSCPEPIRRELYTKFCQSLNLKRRSSREVPNEEKRGKEQKDDKQRSAVHESRRRLQRASHVLAIDNYKILLTEIVKQPGASWTSMKTKIESDIQGRGTDRNLTREDRERLFYEHVEELEHMGINEYQKLLREKLPKLDLSNPENEDHQLPYRSFEAAEKLLYMDPRVIQPPSDVKRRLWKTHVMEMGGEVESRRRKSDKSRSVDVDEERKRSRHHRY